MLGLGLGWGLGLILTCSCIFEQCAYVFFDKGTAKCAIEKAQSEGKIDFKKPISCHLYPIRITKNENYDLKK